MKPYLALVVGVYWGASLLLELFVLGVDAITLMLQLDAYALI
jgi:hypothetical protein